MQDDYIALVTGAGSGIGLATAQMFIEAGATVVGVDSNPTALDAAEETLGERFLAKVCDVAEEPQIAHLAAELAARFGHVDALINNAGIAGRIGIEDVTPEDFDRLFGINLKGPILFVKHIAPLLRQAPAPAIVNVASAAAWAISPNHFLYSSCKLALEKFSRHMVNDLPGIRSNAVLPGAIETPIWEASLHVSEDQKRAIFKNLINKIPARRIGTPQDVARCVMFLCSDDASYINGAAIPIDGGMMCYGGQGYSTRD